MATADVWAHGDSYEAFMGRWARKLASAFLPWLAVPAGMRWLDAGCGTGALSATILAAAEPAEVIGVDAAEGFVAHARAHVPGARFEVADVQALPYEDGRFDVVVSGLVLNFVAEPERAVREFARVGGTVAAYVWDYAEGMEMLRLFWDAARSLDPQAVDEGVRFPLCHPDPLRELWAKAGLGDATVTAIEVPTVFRDFDDFWSPFLGGTGPAPGYVMSLPDDHRAALRDLLRERLGDGPISLTARAWAIRRCGS